MKRDERNDREGGYAPTQPPRAVRARWSGDGRRSDTTRASPAQAGSQGRILRVPTPRELGERSSRIPVSKPRELAYFSKHKGGGVGFDRSNLLRYRVPELGVDLLEGIEGYTPTDDYDPTVPPAPLAPLLAAVEHFQSRITKAPQVVTYRNNLNKILGTPYNTSNPWMFYVEKKHGCLFLDVRRSRDELERNRNPHPRQVDAMYAGRRFELYATASDGSSGSEQHRVNQHEEYCGLFALTLGSTRLLVAAEIDCYDGINPETDEHQYVELKTTRTLMRDKDRFTFERYKLLSFWIQSYIVGTPMIVCGFRDDDFRLQKLQTFKTTDIPSFCRKYWDPHVCVAFAQTLLNWLADSTDEGSVYEVSYDPRAHEVELIAHEANASFLPQMSFSWCQSSSC